MLSQHVSVLLDQSINGLNIKKQGTYFDGTLGGGGHSAKILENSKPAGKLIACDKDQNAIEFCKEKFKKDIGRITFVHDDFKNIKTFLNCKLDGAILDLGVSSYQIDDFSRGFSYRSDDSELDMRMDQTSTLTAKQVVNTYEFDRLKRIISEYGEEKFAHRIAHKIDQTRKSQQISTTGQLKKIIESCVPAHLGGGHPSKRTFQALRIEVNGELDGLDTAIEDIINSLNSGGRICVITFHSLEDRIVKNVFKRLSTGCICDKSLPVCVCNHQPTIKIINNKPITASQAELDKNPRSQSAKLRIAEKT